MDRQNDDGDDRGIDRARLRAGFEAMARASADADIILNSGLVENAVETALNIMFSGNPDLDPVSDALRGGDIEEASAMLADVVSALNEAVARTPDGARAEELRYVLAQFAWSKGAFAACSSLGDGRVWYEAAVDLAPENFWLRLEAVKFLIWSDAAADARAWTMDLLALSPDPDDIVSAFSEIGGVHADRGAYPEALYHYRQALRILERAVEVDETDFQARMDLVRAHGDIATTQEAMGDLPTALESHEAGLTALRALAADNPDDGLLQRLRAGLLVDFALALRRAARWDDARAAYRDALSALERQPRQDPPLLFLMGVSHEGVGDVHEAEGAADEARAAWERARSLFLSCRTTGEDDDPEIPAAREMAEGRLAELLGKLG